MVRVFEKDGFIEAKKIITVLNKLSKILPTKVFEYIASFDMDYIKQNNGLNENCLECGYTIEITNKYSIDENNWYYNIILWE